MKLYLLMSIIFSSFFVACVMDSPKKDSIESKAENKNPLLISKEPKPTEQQIKNNIEDETQNQLKKELQEKVGEYKAKCNAKNGDFCVKLAITYQALNEKGEVEIKELFQKGAKYLQDSCNEGEMHACSGLGSLYESGDGVAKDTQKARQLYEKSCTAKDARGCLNLGLLINDCLVCEKKDSKSTQDALPYFIKACEYGSQNACEMLKKNFGR